MILKRPEDTELLYYELFPLGPGYRKPEKLLPDRVILDTRFEDLFRFHSLIDMFEKYGRREELYVVTNFPKVGLVSSEQVETVKLARYVFFFEMKFPPSMMETAKEKGRRAILKMPESEISSIPTNLFSLSYTGIKVDGKDNGSLTRAFEIIERKILEVDFCFPIAKEAVKEEQYKQVISYDSSFRSWIQELVPQEPKYEGEKRGVISFIKIYWLYEEQFRRLLEVS